MFSKFTKLFLLDVAQRRWNGAAKDIHEGLRVKLVNSWLQVMDALKPQFSLSSKNWQLSVVALSVEILPETTKNNQ